MDKPNRDIDHEPRSARRGAFLRWGAIAVLAVVIAAPTAYSEVSSAQSANETGNLLGDYLSGRIARDDHDINTAAKFYSKALTQDPSDPLLLEQTFLLEVADANWDRATVLAKQLVKVAPSHRIARFLLGCEAFKKGDYATARTDFADARQGPIADLASTLSRAWTYEAQGKTDKALATLDTLSEADWAQFYQRYHRGLLEDAAGRHMQAGQAFAEAFEKNPGTVRIAQAYALHEVNFGDRKKAIEILQTSIQQGGKHPLTEALLAEIKAGKTPPILAKTPTQGLAEVYYGIGDALAGEGGLDMGVVFLQFAIYLNPDLDLAHIALAEAYDGAGKYRLELKAFENIPQSSPLWLNVQIQRAFALNELDQVDQAKSILDSLIKQYPNDIRPLDAAGNILRAHERYKDALPYYDKAIALTGTPKREDWTLYYSRGVCFERLNQWPKAQADLEEALNLSPDESLVLNYLGYTWVDKGTQLQKGMDYIRKAVKLKPEDGYYVDSLGWAYYRTGDLKQAVAQLEHAVELKPEDPIINDHLGDVYWAVGRHLEAKYQWQQALDLKPEPEDVARIKQKLADGLPQQPEKQAADRSGEEHQSPQ